MLKTINRLIFISLGSSCLLFATTANARVNIDVNVNLLAPPSPPARVVMVEPPRGYRTCYMTQGMWFNNVWVPPHRQCEYQGPQGPSVWVSGYWGCLDVGPGGRCGRWRWFNHRMIQQQVTYARPDHFQRYRRGMPAYVQQEQREPAYVQGPTYVNGPSYSHAPAYIRRN